MKLRQIPEDFFVEELTDVQAGSVGEYALYRLEKTGWTTPDAVDAIRERWHLDLHRVSFGGLKDRHAHTVQFLTIWRGPERQLNQEGIRLQYLGRALQPYSSRSFRGNRFRLVIRSLEGAAEEKAKAALKEVERDGVPNYFDDQRFSSVSDGEFVAKAIVMGDYARALWLALAAPYEHDRAAQKREKAILRSHWGDWRACSTQLRQGHSRRLVDHLLRHPDDYFGAVARLRPELRGLYLSAFQSHLWNLMLARWLRTRLSAEQLFEVKLRHGSVPMHRQLDDELRTELSALQVPLPTARGTVEPENPMTILMQGILDEEGLKREQLKVKGIREMFFSKGARSAHCLPSLLSLEPDDDELNRNRRKLLLSFELPKGSYATLIVKRLFGGEQEVAQS